MHQTISIPDQGTSSVAGILLTAYQLRKQLGLGDPDPTGIGKALDVSRSQMYAMAQPVRQLIGAARGPGRPTTPVQAEDISSLVQQLAVSVAFSQWAVEHPGAVCRGPERMHYSDEFRGFVVDLLSPGGIGHGLTRDKAAIALNMSMHTLTHWLSARLPEPRQQPPDVATDDSPEEMVDSDAAQPESVDVETKSGETVVDDCNAAPQPETVQGQDSDKSGDNNGQPDADEVKLPGSQWAATAVQIVDLWERWNGTFAAFCRSLPDHDIHYSYSLVRSILAIGEKRLLKKRRPAHPDAEAIRGELQRMLANVQWHADGKNVLVQMGDEVYRLLWELVVDNGTSAHLGFSVREQEDSVGVLEALEFAKQTAGGPPVGFLRDGRKCNTAQTIEDALDKDQVVSLLPTAGRPQSNSIVETEFGEYQAKMPPIYVPDGLTKVELAMLILWYVLFAYSAGRNQTPRRRLKRKTPAQAFTDTAVSEEEQALARERFLDMKRRIEEQDAANRRRCAPAVRELLSRHFDDYDLEDPRDTYIPQIGTYGPEAALEAMAVFAAKHEAGTLPENNLERYLLGITRNVAYRREDQSTYDKLVDLRVKTGELLMTPLEEHDTNLRTDLPDNEYRVALLDLALKSETKVDRVFWRRRFLEVFADLPFSERNEVGRWCARRIAVRTNIHHRERDHFIALLAEATVPLAA